MYTIIDGKKISDEIKDEIKIETEKFNKKPCLVVVLVGDDKASSVYVKNKEKACEYVGFTSKTYRLESSTTKKELLELVDKLNRDVDVHGILVQLPLPKHIDEKEILYSIDPKKDVDCFHPYNVGLLNIGAPSLQPCTPSGVIELLKRYNIEISGKDCLVIGRSNIVGKPMASLLLKENGTVTIAHSRTNNLQKKTLEADIIIAACGIPKFLKADIVKQGATVIDVGIHRNDDGSLCGDVDFDDAAPKTNFITPVPKGVGPMTIAMLLKNCLIAYKNIEKIEG